MRVYSIDLLRFLAAISVVFYHYTARPSHNTFPELAQVTQFGYLGVPLFFMISGFVIFASAEKGSASKFLISRITRLFPSFWTGVSFTVLVVLLLDQQSTPIIQYLANLTMLNDYLGIPNIDGVYWTLQVELKFYCCVFLLLLLGIFNRHQIWLGGWLLITVIYTLTKQPFFFPWLINPGYSAFFISGIASYLIFRDGPSVFNYALLIVALPLCIYHSHHQATEFMPLATQRQIWSVSGVIVLFHMIFLLIAHHRFELRPLAIYGVLGGLTYPLYLIHNRAGKALLDHYTNSEAYGWIILSTVSVALAVAYLIYRFVEPTFMAKLKAFCIRINTKFTQTLKLPASNQPPAP